MTVRGRAIHPSHMQQKVELHVSPAWVMRVFLQYEPKRGLSLVEVDVLQQVALLGLSSGDQLVLLLVVSEENKDFQSFFEPSTLQSSWRDFETLVYQHNASSVSRYYLNTRFLHAPPTPNASVVF